MTVQTLDVSTTDHYLNSSTPTTAPGLTSSLHSGSNLWSLFEFVLPAAPAGESLVSADLVFRTTTSATAGSAFAQSISLTTSPWSQASTWNTRPTLGALLGTVPANTVTDTQYTVSLDPAVLGPLAGTTVGMCMNGTSSTDSMQWRSSREAVAAYRADLILTYAGATYSAAVTATATVTAPVRGPATAGFTFLPKATVDALAPAPSITITPGASTPLQVGATLIPRNDTRIRFRGAFGTPATPTVFPDGTGTPGSLSVAPVSRSPRTWNTPTAWGLEFILTGTRCEVMFQLASSLGSYRVKVDGQRVTDLPQLMPDQTPVIAGGGTFGLTLAFPTSAARRITLETSYMPFRGIYVTAGNTITAPPPFPHTTIVIGDSIPGSSGQNSGQGNGTYVPRLGDYAGSVMVNHGIGGTGYNAAIAPTFLAHINDVTDYPHDAVIIDGGTNDAAGTALDSAIAATFDALTSGTTKPVYIFGRHSPYFPVIAAVTNVDNAIKAQALAHGYPFWSKPTGNVYSGSGTLLGNVGLLVASSGDVATYIGTDGVHPTDAGHKRLAELARDALILMSASTASFPAAVNATGTVTATLSSLTTPTITPGRIVPSLGVVQVIATGSGTPDSWQATALDGSGNPVQLDGGDGAWSFRAPATWAGTTVTVNIRYTTGGVQSAAAVSVFTVPRHTWWVKGASGWIPLTLNQATPPTPDPSPGLFFKLPTLAEIPPDRRDRKYAVHFYPPTPPRIENRAADGVTNTDGDYYSRNKLNPTGGSETQYAAVGGEMRTRPMPLGLYTGAGTWQADDARKQIQEMLDTGIEIALCNTTNVSGANLTRTQQLRDTSNQEFAGALKVTPTLDTSAASPLFSMAPASVAAMVATFANLQSTPYLPDGRMLIGSFQGDTQTLSWWNSLISILAGAPYGINIAVAGSYNTFSTAVVAHASVLYAAGQWGYGADPAVQLASTGLAGEKATAAANGVLNMRSVWPQDIRPFASVYDDAYNTEAWRVAWAKVIADDPAIVQACTWSDIREGSQLMNTEAQGRVFADIGAYFAAWWKLGQAPKILRPAVYLTYRQAPLSALPTGSQTSTMQQWKPPIAGGRNNTSTPREMVEALVFLPDAMGSAEVRITSNGTTQTFTAPAGMSAHLKAAGLGPVKVEVWQGTVKLIDHTGPIEIRASWVNDHRAYGASGSIRGTAGQRYGWPRVETNPPPPPPADETPWVPFNIPSVESLQATAAARNIITSAHPMGGFWVTPQQPANNTTPDYWDLNWLYDPTDNRSASGLTSSGSTITETATPLANGSVLFFTAKGAATGITLGTVYYVVGKTANTFQVSATSGGTPITLGTATGIAYTQSTLRNLYGGEARDRYARRPIRPEASGVWQVLDIEWEIRAALSAGINAFTWGTSTRTGTEWDRLKYALKAASNHNSKPENAARQFHIIPWVLTLSSISGTPGTETPTVSGQILADLFSGLIKDPVYAKGFRVRNGRVLFMPYAPNAAQNGTGSSATPAAGVVTSGMEFYRALDARMAVNGTPADWFMCFQSNITGLADGFESISAAFGHFGSRDYNTTAGTGTSYGGSRTWIQSTKGFTYRNQAAPPMAYLAPISNQAFVPRGTPSQVGGNGIMWEAGGTLNLINSCLSAIAQYDPNGLNVINVNTWNDFAEGSHMAPSKQNGFGWLDLWSYYMIRMVTGSYPDTVRDGIYLTHRKERTTGATYSSVQKKFVVAAGTPSGSPPTYSGTTWVDIVDVTVFAVTAGTVEVTSGANAPVTFTLVPGRNRFSVPMAVGSQSARIIRSGVTALSFTSPIVVSNTRDVQDLTYYVTSSFANVPRPVPVVPD